ncbi:ShlB/FhaC/HecB family hemolysin secretion/activation protein, partial [Mesorhizobium sp. M7A.F.Ca.US.003.02.2.1]
MPLRKALSHWFDAVRRVSISLATSAFMVGPSLSQTIPERIDSVVSDQNEIIRRYSAPRKPGTIDLSVPDARKATSSEQAEKTMFTLRSITVRGAVTVPSATLEQAWAAQRNKKISAADLYAIAERIDEIYQKAGYFSWAVVPEQDFSS